MIKRMSNRNIREKALAELAGGARITETILANKLGLSRTPVREALASLIEDGIIERRKKFGIAFRIPSVREIVEIYDIRMALEGLAAYLLADHTAPDLINRLWTCCKRMRLDKPHLSGQPISASRADYAFHSLLVDNCGNRHLQRILKYFHVLTSSFRFGKLASPRPLRYKHEDIIAVLKAGNREEAERLVRLHIQEGKEEVLRVLLGPGYDPRQRSARPARTKGR